MNSSNLRGVSRGASFCEAPGAIYSNSCGHHVHLPGAWRAVVPTLAAEHRAGRCDGADKVFPKLGLRVLYKGAPVRVTEPFAHTAVVRDKRLCLGRWGGSSLHGVLDSFARRGCGFWPEAGRAQQEERLSGLQGLASLVDLLLAGVWLWKQAGQSRWMANTCAWNPERILILPCLRGESSASVVLRALV